MWETNKRGSKRRILLPMTLVILFLVSVVGSWGYARRMESGQKVLLYVEKVNGCVQRLCKQELVGNQNDDLMVEVSGILSELQSGKGRYGLDVLEDKEYNKQLQKSVKNWEVFQDNVQLFRKTTDKSKLYEESEEFEKKNQELADCVSLYVINCQTKRNVCAVVFVIVLVAVCFDFIWESCYFRKHD